VHIHLPVHVITIKAGRSALMSLKVFDEYQQLNANNPASIYACFRSFSTENTHTFGRNRNSRHSILPKPKTDRNCIFHRFGAETEFRSVSNL